MKFKVGDRVKVSSGCSGTDPNKIYTLIEDKGHLWTDKAGKPRCYCQSQWTKIGESKMFEVGDKVKINKRVSTASIRHHGEMGIITYTSSSYCNLDIETSYDGGFYYDELTLIERGVKLSKYDELKQRIESLDDGWNKEADDVINEIRGKNGEYYWLVIGNEYNSRIRIKSMPNNKEALVDFRYHSQCEKMAAFRKTLLWLLDHSSIKKDEKADKIRELKSQVDDIQRQIKELE